MNKKIRAARNRTVALGKSDIQKFEPNLLFLRKQVLPQEILNKTINQSLFDAIEFLPENFVDLLFVDPPYNLNKEFNTNTFKKKSDEEYEDWVEDWLVKLKKILKPTSSIYVCGDWESSSALYRVLSRHFFVRNRITWEREKGRGAKSNWKNCSEDIWFATNSKNYFFNPEAVMLKRKVIAPYKDDSGKPKDWISEEGDKYRLTHPSNLWTDITIPFWSMPENTDHPTQKPEKLLAKILLASTKENDVVFDPFLGSGTTSVVAKKLNRNYCGVEIDKMFCLLTEKRLELVNDDNSIQGYQGGIFWERNSLGNHKSLKINGAGHRTLPIGYDQKQPFLFG